MSDTFWTGLFVLLGTAITAWFSWLNGRKLNLVTSGNDKIHTLVNSKMSAALAEIERLKAIVQNLQNGGAIHP
jgi:hypothetical protein